MNIYLRFKMYLKTLVGRNFPETRVAENETDNEVG